MADKRSSRLVVERRIRLRLFRRQIGADPGKVIVLFRQGHPLVELKHGQSLTAGEAAWGRYETAYEVDVGQKDFSFQCELPAKGAAFNFHAAVQGTFYVSKPKELVEHPVDSPIESVIKPRLLTLMRVISQGYEIDSSLEAEEAMRTALQEAKLDMPFSLDNMLVTLDLDQSTRGYLEDKQDAMRKADLNHQQRTLEVELTRQQLQTEVELEKERQALAEATAALELEKQKHVLEQGRIQAQHELEVEEIRLEFYKPLVRQGSWDVLALELANNPEDVTRVATMMREMRDQEINARLKILEIALDKDAIEPSSQFDDAMKRILQDMVTVFRAGGPPELAQVEASPQVTAGAPESEVPNADTGQESETTDRAEESE